MFAGGVLGQADQKRLIEWRHPQARDHALPYWPCVSSQLMYVATFIIFAMCENLGNHVISTMFCQQHMYRPVDDTPRE